MPRHDDAVRLDETVAGTQRRIPIGRAPGGNWVQVDLDQTPHIRIVAKPGRGATNLLRYVAAWTARHEARVTSCDAYGRTRTASPFAPLAPAGVEVRAGLNDVLDAIVEYRESMDAYWRAFVRDDLDGGLSEDQFPTRFLLVDGLPVLQAAALASGRGTWQQIWGHLTTLVQMGGSVRHYLVVASQHVTELDNVFRDAIGVHVGLEPVSLATRWRLFRNAPAGCFSRSSARGSAVVRVTTADEFGSPDECRPCRPDVELWRVSVPYLTNAEALAYIANRQAGQAETEDA